VRATDLLFTEICAVQVVLDAPKPVTALDGQVIIEERHVVCRYLTGPMPGAFGEGAETECPQPALRGQRVQPALARPMGTEPSPHPMNGTHAPSGRCSP
jgi:hypothetical protein